MTAAGRPVSIQARLPNLVVSTGVWRDPRMTTHKNFIPALLISLFMGVAGTVSAQSSESTVTLDQAVLKVQQDTDGKVLSAEQRGVGRRQEYRIKVLTPEGHVKVMVVSSEPGKNSASTQSIKNSPAKNAGSKEKR
ncbi:PepSY domain-containing protein [Rhodanobacter sp. Col0626]|uniref:PepSY domain-containing protein n=1 Tax=Rhodanobacter sp. Col0626 TaxID=3415679 RepID=UPI003CED5C4F